jgi:hypothetical protein
LIVCDSAVRLRSWRQQLARQLGAELRRIPGDATVVRVEFDLTAAGKDARIALSSAPAMNS